MGIIVECGNGHRLSREVKGRILDALREFGNTHTLSYCPIAACRARRSMRLELEFPSEPGEVHIYRVLDVFIPGGEYGEDYIRDVQEPFVLRLHKDDIPDDILWAPYYTQDRTGRIKPGQFPALISLSSWREILRECEDSGNRSD